MLILLSEGQRTAVARNAAASSREGGTPVKKRGNTRYTLLALSLAFLLACAALLAGGCGKKSAETTPQATSPETATTSAPAQMGAKVFTARELAGFDGKSGNPAYVAVDGVVYDVTGSDEWPGGKHSPCSLDAAAGKDLSEIIKQAPPRMRTYIEAKPVVGKLQGS